MSEVVIIDEHSKAVKITRSEAADLIAGLAACLAEKPGAGVPRIKFGNEFYLYISPLKEP